MTTPVIERAAPRADRVELLVDVGAAVAASGASGERHMAVDVFFPDPDAARDSVGGVILCCLPGGGVDRRYYDLEVAGEPSPTHSFAKYLSGAGFVVVTADHLGVGQSSPAPPLELTVEVLAAGADRAMGAVVSGLQAGSLDHRIPPLPHATAIGVGHSMGAMLTVIQQARHRSYAALALLGFGNRGLPDFLPPDLLRFADDQDGLRANLPDILRRRLVEQPAPQPDQSTTVPPAAPRRHGPLFHGDKVPGDVVEAVRAIAAPAPPLAAMTSMVPGSISREMATVDVPVLVANGELDITGPIDEIVPCFESSPGVTTLILPATAHSHHAFPGRVVLWDHLAAWSHSLADLQKESR